MGDVTEELAAISFLENFINNYGETYPPFCICPLSEAIVKASFSSECQRKILLLYFHNETNEFSKMFCKSLTKGEIRDIIEDHCLILPWDIQYATYHRVLIESINFNLDPALAKFIEKKSSAIFIIFPVENTPTIFSVIHSKVKEKELLSTLNQSIKSFQECCTVNFELNNIMNENSSVNDFTSTKYQQLMFDQLGDRDYDRFEENEHEYLKDKIGFSLFGPPQDVDGYEQKQKETIEKMYTRIIACNDEISQWKNNVVISFIYNCTEPLPEEKIKKSKKYEDYNPNTDILPVPLYILRKCEGSDDPCRIIIDSDLRVYKDWEDYITNNELPKCQMILPKNGRYNGDKKGDVVLEKHLSPACGVGKMILLGADITTTTVGLASGGVFAAALIPAITVAPIALAVAGAAGIGVGIYSIVRSSITLADRYKHKQEMNLKSSEARGAYINIVAGSLGFVGAGANLAVSQLVARGVAIGQGARVTVNIINVANIGASGLGIANASYDVYDQWQNNNRAPSALTILQLSSSILFFGNAVYNFKTAGTIIDETQTNTLRDIQDSLRSNRHRKTFNKLMKETVRQSGDARTGRAEVISSIRNLNNRDEVLAVLTRSNKLFNENKIKFAAQNGKITLNGMAVDIEQFGSMSKDQSYSFLVDLPTTPPTPQEISSVSECLQSYFNVKTLDTLMAFGNKLVFNGHNLASAVSALINMLTDYVQEKIIHMLTALVDKFIQESFDFLSILKRIFPNTSQEPLIILLKLVMNFIKIKMNEFEENYQKEKQEAQKSPDFNENEFNAQYRVHPVTCKRLMQHFEKAITFYFCGVNPTEYCIRELSNYCRNWLTLQVFKYSEEYEKNKSRKPNKMEKKCAVCSGYNYCG